MKKMFLTKNTQKHAQKLVKFNTAPKFGLVRQFGGVKTSDKNNIVAKNSFKMTKTLVFNQGKNCVKIFARNFCNMNKKIDKNNKVKFDVISTIYVDRKDIDEIIKNHIEEYLEKKIDDEINTHGNSKVEHEPGSCPQWVKIGVLDRFL